MTFAIVFYELDLAFGEPEQDGRCYETGEIVRPVRITRTGRAALVPAAGSLLEHRL